MNELGRRVARLELVHGAKTEAATIDPSRLTTGLLRRLVEGGGIARDLTEVDLVELASAGLPATGSDT